MNINVNMYVIKKHNMLCKYVEVQFCKEIRKNKKKMRRLLLKVYIEFPIFTVHTAFSPHYNRNLITCSRKTILF
jgi:hypothetical protein